MKTIPLTRGLSAMVDDEDYESLAPFHWRAQPGGQAHYAVRTSSETPRQTVRMHRQILDVLPGQDVDHRNGDGLDNQRANLRACSRSENLDNQRPRHGSSSFKGVSWVVSRSKWQAVIQPRPHREFLGYFATEVAAARAYNAAALRLFGEFARLNDVPDADP